MIEVVGMGSYKHGGFGFYSLDAIFLWIYSELLDSATSLVNIPALELVLCIAAQKKQPRMSD